MVRNGRGSREEQNPTGGVIQNRRKSWRSKVKQSQVSSFDRRRSGWFSAARMVGERRTASKLQIGTNLHRWGGRNRKKRPGHVRGLGRVSGSVVASVWQLPFTLSLSHVHVFTCFQLILLLIKSLTASFSF